MRADLRNARMARRCASVRLREVPLRPKGRQAVSCARYSTAVAQSRPPATLAATRYECGRTGFKTNQRRCGMTDARSSASCRCGKVELQLTGAPILRAICYCASCQEAGRRHQGRPASIPCWPMTAAPTTFCIARIASAASTAATCWKSGG